MNAYDECKNKSLNLYALIKEDFDGLWFVDFMLAAPNITLIPTIARILQEKADFYANENDRVKQKINWMISYFNSYCIAFRDRGDYDGYVLSLI